MIPALFKPPAPPADVIFISQAPVFPGPDPDPVCLDFEEDDGDGDEDDEEDDDDDEANALIDEIPSPEELASPTSTSIRCWLCHTDRVLRELTAPATDEKVANIRVWPYDLSDKQRWCLAQWLAQAYSPQRRSGYTRFLLTPDEQLVTVTSQINELSTAYPTHNLRRRAVNLLWKMYPGAYQNSSSIFSDPGLGADQVLAFVHRWNQLSITGLLLQATADYHQGSSPVRRNIKYAVFPGYVTSINDGDRHFISLNRLCQLYGVSPRECIDASRLPKTAYGDLILLRPRLDGNYQIPSRYDG